MKQEEFTLESHTNQPSSLLCGYRRAQPCCALPLTVLLRIPFFSGGNRNKRRATPRPQECIKHEAFPGFFWRSHRLHRHFKCNLKLWGLPEQEVTEEIISLPYPEVIQESLGDAAGVFEEAREPCEHFNNLQGRQVVRLLHVLHTRRQTFFFCKDKKLSMNCLYPLLKKRGLRKNHMLTYIWHGTG